MRNAFGDRAPRAGQQRHRLGLGLALQPVGQVVRAHGSQRLLDRGHESLPALERLVLAGTVGQRFLDSQQPHHLAGFGLGHAALHPGRDLVGAVGCKPAVGFSRQRRVGQLQLGQFTRIGRVVQQRADALVAEQLMEQHELGFGAVLELVGHQEHAAIGHAQAARGSHGVHAAQRGNNVLRQVEHRAHHLHRGAQALQFGRDAVDVGLQGGDVGAGAGAALEADVGAVGVEGAAVADGGLDLLRLKDDVDIARRAKRCGAANDHAVAAISLGIVNGRVVLPGLPLPGQPHLKRVLHGEVHGHDAASHLPAGPRELTCRLAARREEEPLLGIADARCCAALGRVEPSKISRSPVVHNHRLAGRIHHLAVAKPPLEGFRLGLQYARQHRHAPSRLDALLCR